MEGVLSICMARSINTQDNPADEIDKLISSLSSDYSISFVLADEESQKKLGWLADDGRDFLAASPAMDAAITNALKSFVADQPERTLQEALGVAGDVILRHVLKRFAGNKDVPMTPLSPKWVATKNHNRIGLYSHKLFRDLVNAEVIIQKK